MLGALFGMFGSSFADFANNLSPASSAAQASNYLSACTDQDINNSGIATDPFCNPIYGTPDASQVGNTQSDPGLDYGASDGTNTDNQNDTMDVQTVMNQMSADNADAVDASDTLYGLLAKAGSTPTCQNSYGPDSPKEDNGQGAGPQYAYNWYYGASTTCDAQDPAASFLKESLSQFDYNYMENASNKYECDYIPAATIGDPDGVDGAGFDNDTCHHYGTITDFIQQCVTRNITNDTNDGLYDNKEYWVPMGEFDYSGAESGHDSGKFYNIGNGGEKNNGAYGSSSTNCSINFGENELLYNYLQFDRVNNAMNQGSQLGSQADGSATN